MKYNLYSIYDRLSKRFSQPQGFINDETALRWFHHVVKNSDMIAEDLELFRVGEFNETDGVIVGSVEKIYSNFKSEELKKYEKKASKNEEVKKDEKKASKK